jgi:hypothetical protein
VRSTGGRKRATHEQRKACDSRDEPESSQLERDERLRSSPPESERLERQHHRTGEQRHREQQMGGDDRPPQVALHREVPERSLGECSEEDADGEPARPAWQPTCRERTHRGDQGGRDHDPAEGAVPELDVRVVVLRRQRVSALATRPVAATEA